MAKPANLFPIGAARHRVEIHEATESFDAHRNVTRVWSKATGGDRWAKIEEVSGKESRQGAQIQMRTSLRILCRYFPGLSPAHKIVWGARTFAIDSVINPDGTKKIHLVFCTETL